MYNKENKEILISCIKSGSHFFENNEWGLKNRFSG